MTDKTAFWQAYEMLCRYYTIELSENELDEISAHFSEVKVKKGETLIHIGDSCKFLYFVVRGVMRDYYIDKDGNDATRFFNQEGSICGADGMFIDFPSSICTEALEDSLLLKCSYADFRGFIRDYSAFREAWTVALEMSLAYKIKRENCFLTQSAAERYIDFKRSNPELEKRVSQKHIASYLGITPVSLSRIRRAIRELD